LVVCTVEWEEGDRRTGSIERRRLVDVAELAAENAGECERCGRSSGDLVRVFGVVSPSPGLAGPDTDLPFLWLFVDPSGEPGLLP
jgi:hypothetical protein